MAKACDLKKGSLIGINGLPHIVESLSVTTPSARGASSIYRFRFRNLVRGQVVNVYTGTAQGRTYLGRFVATGTTGTFTMTRAQQVAAGVSGQVFAGAVITATRSSTDANGQTSSLSRAASARRI